MGKFLYGEPSKMELLAHTARRLPHGPNKLSQTYMGPWKGLPGPPDKFEKNSWILTLKNGKFEFPDLCHLDANS